MNELIKNAYEQGRLLLLLGAGASSECKNRAGNPPPSGGDLARILAGKIGIPYHQESLADVYAASKAGLGSDLERVLDEHYKHCKPSAEMRVLMMHPIPRIYSLNIDDTVEQASFSAQKRLNVRRRNDRLHEMDAYFETFELVKLNGDINVPRDGFIFSSQEYAKGSTNEPLWYQELGRDFSNYTFLFIGSKLNEPLFYHQVEKYKFRSGSSSGKSFLLVPELTAIESISLEQHNIDHISGTLKDFTDWLTKTYPVPLEAHDIVKNRNPHVTFLESSKPSLTNPLRHVVAVNRASLSLKERSGDQIRPFYKGFKPDWSDILEGVPAWLGKPSKWMDSELLNAVPSTLHMIYGIAGSGKTTALMQIALKLSEQTARNVYYIDEYVDEVRDLIKNLEERNDRPFYIVFDRAAHIAPWLSDVISSGDSNNAIFISSENSSIWKSKVEEHLGELVSSSLDISKIDDSDADLILDKIKDYGNWTRLQKMPIAQRRREVLKKAKNQLLIGLIEATSGEGYLEIIGRDYEGIEDESHRHLLIMAGFATQKRVQAGEANLSRALSYLGGTHNVSSMCERMYGILSFKNGFVTTRHRTYIEKLFANYVSPETLLEVVSAYIKAFSVFDFPIVQNISRTEAEIYKHLVNFKVLKKLFRKDKEKILAVYRSFEKTFEHEGLFLMQYGLALRSFGDNPEAYEKLRIANQAFPTSPQISHALAQQKLIMVSMTDSETQALNLLDEAVDSLNQLIAGNVRVYDRYPIITLSEGHVKALDSLGQWDQAKHYAKHYHSRLSKDKHFEHNDRVQQTVAALMKYYLTGRWPVDGNDIYEADESAVN